MKTAFVLASVLSTAAAVAVTGCGQECQAKVVDVDNCGAGKTGEAACSVAEANVGNSCTELAGEGFECVCGAEFETNAAKNVCEAAVDDCAVGDACTKSVAENTCVDGFDSVDCTCGATGYYDLGNNCVNTNPCDANPCGVVADDTCAKTEGAGFTCTCGSADNYMSEDAAGVQSCKTRVDECDTEVDGCSVATANSNKCSNVVDGLYTCECGEKYTASGDMSCVLLKDECLKTEDNLCGDQACHDTALSYTCDCAANLVHTTPCDGSSSIATSAMAVVVASVVAFFSL